MKKYTVTEYVKELTEGETLEFAGCISKLIDDNVAKEIESEGLLNQLLEFTFELYIRLSRGEALDLIAVNVDCKKTENGHISSRTNHITVFSSPEEYLYHKGIAQTREGTAPEVLN